MHCYICKLTLNGFDNFDKELKLEVDQSASSEAEKSECSEDEDKL